MGFTAIEQEIICLTASIASIDSMVNLELLTISETAYGAQARFKSSIHQRLFNILLLDFLSQSSKAVMGEDISCLDALVKVSQKPSFNKKNSVKSLRHAVRAFKKWLEHEIKVSVWFPSIDYGGKLGIKRREFIAICGDISKHNFSRLTRRASDVRKILTRNRKNISEDDALLLLSDFHEKFHADIFTYKGSHLVEQINHIRWGIHEYLQPELKQGLLHLCCFPPRYSYNYPADITASFAKSCYRELMNAVSVTPCINKFKTVRSLIRQF